MSCWVASVVKPEKLPSLVVPVCCLGDNDLKSRKERAFDKGVPMYLYNRSRRHRRVIYVPSEMLFVI
jgi:hypothetical protein